MSSLRNQQSVDANAPRVLLYENYVMYDRWMSYDRFNSYYQDDVTPWESREENRKYYNKNVMNFLVLKFNRKVNGSIGNWDIILLDANFKHLYYLGDYIHVAEVDVSYLHNNFFDRTFPVARIVNCRPPHIDCIGLVDGRWCNNLHSGQNGYCNEHQDQSHEFEDVDIDRLLTLGELLNLPEFEGLRDLEFHLHTNDDEDYYLDDDQNEYHDFDGFYDYDDRRHGPENTIEDDDEIIETEEEVKTETEEKVKTEVEEKVKTEVEEKVKTEVEEKVKTEVEEKVKTEVKEKVKTEVKTEVKEKTEENVEMLADESLHNHQDAIYMAKGFLEKDKDQQKSEFIKVARRLFHENARQHHKGRKIEAVTWLYKVFNSETGHYYMKQYQKLATNAHEKAKEFKNDIVNCDLVGVEELQDILQDFLDDTLSIYQSHQENKVVECAADSLYTFHMLTRRQKKLREAREII